MATKYWIANQTSGTALTANTAANWNTAADGSGSTGVPGATDDCVFGDALTMKSNKGNAVCRWDIGQVQSITVNPEYKYETSLTTTTIVFDSTANTLTDSVNNFEPLGFRVGMYITIAGSAGNSGSFYITAISNNIMTINSVSANESAGPSVTISSESSIDIYTDVTLGNTSSAQTALALDGALKNTRGANSTITFTGLPNADNRWVTNGEYAVIYNQDDITYDFGSGISTGVNIYFDDGPYPKVTSAVAHTFRPDYHRAPTSTVHGAVTMYSLQLTNTGVTFAGTRNSPKNDASKVFKLLTTSTFDYNGNTFDAGLATFDFTINSATFTFPVSGSTSYGANDGSFKGIWYGVVIRTDGTAGRKATIASGRTLSLNNLTIESGASLEGPHQVATNETSVITTVRRPIIKGSWNYSQIADGIYTSVVSDSFPITPSHGTGGNVQLSDHAGKFISDNNLTFDITNSILHADEGIKLTDTSDHPLTPATGFGQIWVKSSDNKLYFTDESGTDHDLLASGGGGGGGMTSWTLSGDSGANQSITDGNTVDIAGGTGISTAASATDTLTVTNTGVTSNVAGTGIGVSGATGAVTINNTGVTSNVAGTNVTVSGATGAVTINADFAGAPAPVAPAFSAVPDNAALGLVPYGFIGPVTLNDGTLVFIPAFITS
jgi:hypothetical protein